MKLNWKILVASIGVVALIMSFTRKSIFKKKLIALANQEWEKWNNPKVKEGNAKTIQDLRNYYKIGAKANGSDQYYIDTAWSGAFISYLMRKSGADDKFKYSLLHSDYIQDAKRNRKNGIKTFQAFKKNEMPIEEGDLICYPRTPGITYDSPGSYKAHCDVVVSIADGTAIAIGGNVSDSVSKSKYQLDSNNKVITDKVHTIIKNYL